MNHEQIQECIEAHALGALDEPERAEVATHVAGCEDCRAVLDQYENVAATLPAALSIAAPVPPSDVARRRIRRGIRNRAMRSRVATSVAVAAVILLSIAIAWVWRGERTLADERERSEQLIEEQEIVFEVVDSPDAERVVLRAESEDSNSYGKVFTRPDLPFVVAMVGRLPEAGEGHDYHVWVTFEDGTTVLAGSLVPNVDGFASLVYAADSDGPVVIGAQVTVEPSGVTRPEGEVVLSSDTA